LHCPIEGCTYVWCKECQQEIVPTGLAHSCDGSSELKHLVQQRGWKYCPSKISDCRRGRKMTSITVCNTPCEKISFIFPVSQCIAPGCRSCVIFPVFLLGVKISDAGSHLPEIFATSVADGSPDLLQPSHKEGETKCCSVDAETHDMISRVSSPSGLVSGGGLIYVELMYKYIKRRRFGSLKRTSLVRRPNLEI